MGDDASSSNTVGLADRPLVGCGKGHCASDGEGAVLIDADSQQAKELFSLLCPSWHVESDGKMISREFVAKNFAAALAALNSYGAVAEEFSHHPDFRLYDYRKVTVTMTSHSAGGLTLSDFIMAAKFDRITVDYSPKFVKENPSMTAGLVER